MTPTKSASFYKFLHQQTQKKKWRSSIWKNLLFLNSSNSKHWKKYFKWRKSWNEEGRRHKTRWNVRWLHIKGQRKQHRITELNGNEVYDDDLRRKSELKRTNKHVWDHERMKGIKLKVSNCYFNSLWNCFTTMILA